MGEDKRENIDLKVDSARHLLSADGRRLTETAKKVEWNISCALSAFAIGAIWAFISPCVSYWGSVIISLVILGIGSWFGNKARKEIREIRSG